MNIQQLYNITEDLNNLKQNECNHSTSTPQHKTQTTGKLNVTLSDESIIYIDSIDNIDCFDNSSFVHTETSSFMTTSSSSSSSSSNCSTESLKANEQQLVAKKIMPSLKIHIHGDEINVNHDYHAIDERVDCGGINTKSQNNNRLHVLEPPSIPPPPLPPLPTSNITQLTNSIDTIEYTAKLMRQQKQQQQQQQQQQTSNCVESNNCYEKSWENSTSFLIDKLLNKYNSNVANSNSTCSFSNSSSSGTNSSANSNRNSTILVAPSSNNEQILLLQAQQLLKQNLMNSFKNCHQTTAQKKVSLSPTNTLSSTNSLFSNSINCNSKTNNGSILMPPKIPPPPLPYPVVETIENAYRRIQASSSVRNRM